MNVEFSASVPVPYVRWWLLPAAACQRRFTLQEGRWLLAFFPAHPGVWSGRWDSYRALTFELHVERRDVECRQQLPERIGFVDCYSDE